MICAGHDDDQILCVIGDADQRAPRRLIDRGKVSHINGIGNECRALGVACAVASDGADDCSASPGSCRGNRLIGALATARLEVSVRRHGLTRMRKSCRQSDEVEVG